MEQREAMREKPQQQYSDEYEWTGSVTDTGQSVFRIKFTVSSVNMS